MGVHDLNLIIDPKLFINNSEISFALRLMLNA